MPWVLFQDVGVVHPCVVMTSLRPSSLQVRGRFYSFRFGKEFDDDLGGCSFDCVGFCGTIVTFLQFQVRTGVW